MVTAYQDELGRDYYIDPNTGKKIGKVEAYVQAGTGITPEGRRVDIGDTGKRTGTGFFGMDKGKTKQGAGTTYQRALVREEAGIGLTEEMKGKGFSETRKKYAKARRADRRLKRTEERRASRASRKGLKKGQDRRGLKRVEKLEAKAGTIATGAGGRMTQEDRAKASYFEDLNQDRQQTAAKKVMEVATIVATAGVLAGAGVIGGGGATVASGTGATATTGATAATGTATVGTTTGGLTAASGSGMGSLATSQATIASLAPAATGTATVGSSSALGTTAVASGGGSGALTLGEKIIKGGQQAKEYYDKAKPYINTAKTIAGAFKGGGEEPSGAGRGAPQIQPPAYAVGQPSMGYGGYGGAPQQPLVIGGDPSMAGMSSGMPDQQMQSIAGALGAGAQDNYDLATFVNQSDLQTLYAEKGGRIKQKTDYPEQILKHGGRIKTA